MMLQEIRSGLSGTRRCENDDSFRATSFRGLKALQRAVDVKLMTFTPVLVGLWMKERGLDRRTVQEMVIMVQLSA